MIIKVLIKMKRTGLLFFILIMLHSCGNKNGNIKYISWNGADIPANAVIKAENNIAGYINGVFILETPSRLLEDKYISLGYVKNNEIYTKDNVTVRLISTGENMANILVRITP